MYPRCSLVRPFIVALLLLPGWLAPAATADFIERLVPATWDTEDVVVADFDRDGIQDLAAVSHYGPFTSECILPPPYPADCGPRMQVVVARGQGLGRFAPPVEYQAMCAPWTLVAGDFDGNGTVDLVVGNRGARDAFGICSAASLSLFRGDGDGGLEAPLTVVVPDETTDIAAGDFDDDGHLDVAVAFGPAGKVEVFHFTPAGAIQAGGFWTAGTEVGSLAVGDLGPGVGDEIAVTLPLVSRVAILDYFPGGALGPREICDTHAAQTRPRSVAIADFVPDGVADIAVLNSGPLSTSTSTVSLLQRGGAATYCLAANARETEIGGKGANIAAIDIDADGVMDLAATNGAAHFRTLHGDGTGFFFASPPIPTSDYANQVVSGDFEPNGVGDLAFAGPRFLQPTGGVLALINTFPAATDLTLDLSGDAIGWIGVRDAQSYDVVRGDLAILNAGGGNYTNAVEACVADDGTAPGLSLADDPPVGALWWILARPNFVGGPGSYDSDEPSRVGSRDAGINASALTCP